MSDLDNEFERGNTLGVEVVMRRILSLAVMCSLAFPGMALAEEPEAPKQSADDMDKEYEGMTPPEEHTIPAEEAMPEPPRIKADDMAKEYGAEEPSEGEHPFLDGLSWQAMASAFYRLGGYIGNGVLAGDYNTLYVPDEGVGYPYTGYNGFGVNFVGGMAQYTGDKFGVTVDLRFGTGAPLLTPLAPVKQGYVSYLPTERISIDFGFFDTIFGAEVADEWNNANYTRGALYFLRQPFNHMGIRSAFELSDKVGFTFMLTDGGVLGGVTVATNETPAIGWQFAFTPKENIGLFVGGNHAASGSNGNRDWENFFDVVLNVNIDWFTLIFNGDYQVNPHVPGSADAVSFEYGNSLAFVFDASDKVSIGLRGENLSGNQDWRDFSGQSYGSITTGTITLRYKPVEYLVLSLEGRGEWASREIYYSRTSPVDDTVPRGLIPNKTQNYAVILGASAHIGN